MKKTAHIRLPAKSPFYEAVYWVWNHESSQWERKWESTKCENKRKAEGIAETYQALALKASGQAEDCHLTRDDVLETVNYILRLAGHTPVVETRAWAEYSAEWLNRVMMAAKQLMMATA